MQRAHLQRGCTRPQQATNSRPLRGLSALGISGNERYAYPRRLAVGSRPALAGAQLWLAPLAAPARLLLWQRPPARRAAAAAGAGSAGRPQAGSESELSESECEPEPDPAAQGPHSDLVTRALQLPLELAASESNVDSHYLEKRDRTKWWGREPFPKDTSTPGSSKELGSRESQQQEQRQGQDQQPRLPVAHEQQSLLQRQRQWQQPPQQCGQQQSLQQHPASDLQVAVDSLDDVHKHPPSLKLWQKVAPLAIIFFGASFNLTILQTLKDSIMVTTAGAETLPFLSSFCVLPASIAFFMLYGRMVEALPPRAVFYAAVAPLLGFYALFATVLYPISGALHPHGLLASLAPMVPTGLHGLIKVVEYWTFSLFFCLAELWGSVVISVLFWSLANEVCNVKEAKVVYPLMGIAANVALVVSGNLVKLINSTVASGSTLLSLRYLVATVVGMSGVMMLAKAATDKFVISKEGGGEAKPAKKKKKKGSFGESFAVLTSSPKIRNLAMLVMSYGVSHRLFEFAWKGQLRLLYPTSTAYQSFLADVSIATGYTTIGLMLAGRFVFQYLGWSAAAAATPGVMFVAGGAFFGLSLAANQGLSVAGMGPAAMALAGAMAGAVTQVFARSSKFSLFDPAKEMVYIEMTAEEKSKGKAAVDLVGSQIGKSGAAWLTQALLLVLGSITASLPIISACFVGVITAWLAAVRSLDQQIKAYEAQKEVAAAGQPDSSGEPAAVAAEAGASAAMNGAGPAGAVTSHAAGDDGQGSPASAPGSAAVQPA